MMTMPPQRHAVKATLLSLAVFTAAASAQNVESVSVSADRIEKNLSEQSLSLTVIAAEDIRTVNHQHISELLNRAAGVWISRGNGQEHLTAIRSPVLTGPGSCGAFYFAEDGIPLRAPGFCNVNALFDVNSEQAGRIEVIRGPGTAVHGSNALNGVVNVISAAPSEENETRFAVEAGPHEYSRARLSQSNRHGKHGYRLNLQGNHDGGYKDNSGFDQQKFSFRHDYAGEVWHIQSLLSGSNLNQDTAGYLLGEDAYKDDSRKKENPNPEAFRNSSTLRYYSRFEREGQSDSRFVVTPYLRYNDMEFLQHFLPGQPLEENGERTIGVQTAFYQTLSEDVTLYNGFDMELTRAYLEQSQSQPSFGAFPQGQHYDYEVDARYGAWFIGGDWQASEASLVNFGARYDIQFYDYDNRMVDGNSAADGSPCPTAPCRYARPRDDEQRFRNWSFYAGLVHALSDHTDLLLNANQGFRAPQASELYRLQSQQLSADLQEESLASVEWGLRGQWPQLRYKVVAYWMKKDDVIIQDDLRRNLNDGKTEHRGIELELSWQIVDSLSWSLQASYSKQQYDNNVLDAEGKDIDTAPRQLASSQLQWRPLAGTLLELEWVHQGEYYLDVDNQFRYPGHDLVNLRWRQQLGDKVYAGLRVTNLTDEDYAERADYAFGDYRYFVGEPRAAYIELGINF